jgi:hypothetical protein
MRRKEKDIREEDKNGALWGGCTASHVPTKVDMDSASQRALPTTPHPRQRKSLKVIPWRNKCNNEIPLSLKGLLFWVYLVNFESTSCQ